MDDPGSVCQPGSEQNRALFGFVEKSSHILLIPSVYIYIYIVYIAYFHIFPKSFYGISVGFLCDFHDISMGLLQLPLSKRSHRSGEPMVETVWNMISEWRPRALHLGVGKWGIPGRNPVDLGVLFLAKP